MEMNDQKWVRLSSIQARIMQLHEEQLVLFNLAIETLTDEGKEHGKKVATNEEILERV